MVYDTFVMAGPTTHLVLREEDVVKLSLEFLQNRDLHISQVTLERETGVINGHFSDDLLFLRQLVSTVYVFPNLNGPRLIMFNNCRFSISDSRWTMG